MNRKWMIKFLGILCFFAVFACLIYYANYDKPGYYKEADKGSHYETARVLKILEDHTSIDETTENILRGSMELEVEILTGSHEGEIYSITNYLSSKYNVIPKKNSKISVRIDVQEDSVSVSVYNYHRQTFLIGLLAVFCLTLIGIGGKKGLMAIIGLVFTFICIVFILIPLTLKGFPVLPVTVGIVGVTTFLSLWLLGGIQNKTLSSFFGCMAGILVAALLAVISGKIAHINGFQMDDAEGLFLIKEETQLHIRDLFISGVLISSIGAIMDVAMSIASSVHELCQLNPDIDKKTLFLSGMNVGRDAMGTMANTLILAFAGTSLNVMILIYSYGVTYRQLMNTDFIAIELIRSISGSMGIVFTVPAVAYLSTYIFKTRQSTSIR